MRCLKGHHLLLEAHSFASHVIHLASAKHFRTSAHANLHEAIFSPLRYCLQSWSQLADEQLFSGYCAAGESQGSDLVSSGVRHDAVDSGAARVCACGGLVAGGHVFVDAGFGRIAVRVVTPDVGCCVRYCVDGVCVQYDYGVALVVPGDD